MSVIDNLGNRTAWKFASETRPNDKWGHLEISFCKLYYSVKEATLENYQNQAFACFNPEDIGELWGIKIFNETISPK